jgi:hypothetical protein
MPVRRPGSSGRDGILEFLDHVAGGELPEVAAHVLAIGVAPGSFGE